MNSKFGGHHSGKRSGRRVSSRFGFVPGGTSRLSRLLHVLLLSSGLFLVERAFGTTNYLIVDDLALQLPLPEDNTLHILSTNILELKRITSKSPGAPPTSWDFVDSNGRFAAPATTNFTVSVNGNAVGFLGVKSIAFKRRVLYLATDRQDIRIENCLYFRLATIINDGDTVVVTNPNHSLWPSSMTFVSRADPLRFNPAVHVNQEGYVPGFPKKAMVGYYLAGMGELTIPSLSFSIVNNAGSSVFSGTLVARPDSGFADSPYQKVYEADFTGLISPGEYRLKVDRMGASLPFLIDDGIPMGFVRTYALGLYHQRCGTNNALPYTRHTHAVCHTAAASIPIPESSFLQTWYLITNFSGVINTENPPLTLLTDEATQLYPIQKRGMIDVSGGHHDAGDYSKYTLNVAQLIHYLVFAVDNIPDVGYLDNLGIPESGDGKSDLLQEAKWEADFLSKMQDDDGGFFFLVYPKDRDYEDNVTPDHGDPQVVWPKNTAATAAAVGALAEIASSPLFRQQFPNAAGTYMQKATNGWKFLTNAIATYGITNSYQKITSYGDWNIHMDELAWAAAALFAATGDPAYQTKLMNWFPNPNDPNTYHWGWERLFEGYGPAIRDYAFAAKSGRLLASQLNSVYLSKCVFEILSAGTNTLRAYQQTAYGTSFPSDTKASGDVGWYFATAEGFNMVAADLLAPNAAYLAAILGNMNYEGGCNPVNVTYLTGLGQKRQRIIVHQYANNDRRILPPSGIPLGAIQHGFGDECHDGFFSCDELRSLAFPWDFPAPPKIPYPFYDRWEDAWNVSTEFVCPNMARGLATLTYLARRTRSQTEPWTAVQGAISVVSSATAYSSVTATFAGPLGINLDKASVVWEAFGQEPAFGQASFGQPFSFVPVGGNNYWIEAEAELPDGRRIFATNSVVVTTPGGGSEFGSDIATAALYHFNADFKDSTIHHHDLVPTGNVTLAADNSLWMRNPSGSVARFTGGGNELNGSIDDSQILPDLSAQPTIEFWIYPRAFKAQADQTSYPVVRLYQSDAAQFSLWNDAYADPPGPAIYGPTLSGSPAPVVTSAQWNANVSLNNWHLVRIQYSNAFVRCYVDGNFLAAASRPADYANSNPWTLTVGNFDGDIDELRITKTLVQNPVPTVSVIATDPTAAEPGLDPGYFTIFRSGSTDSPLTVTYTIGGTATANSDYATIGTSVIIPAGAAFATVVVSPLADALWENNETVTMTLNISADYTNGTAATAALTIADKVVSIAASDPNASEQGSDPATFTVTRAGDTSQQLVVGFRISGGTATLASDYNVGGPRVSFTNSTRSGTVTIAAGAMSEQITITPIDDSSPEPTETVVLTLLPNAAYGIGSPDSATVSILDNDPGAPTLTSVATLAGAVEDTPFTISFTTLATAGNEADVNGDAICFRVEAVSSGSLMKNGVPVIPGSTLLCSGEKFMWTPAANANGTVPAFTIKAWDGALASSSPIQVSVAVTPVNDQPTLNSLPDLTVNYNAGQQTVSLTGISAGPGESQDLIVAATSSNRSLIPNPVVTYTNPNTTGTLRFTPAQSASGSAVITVTVNDQQFVNNTFSRTFTVRVLSDDPNYSLTIIPSDGLISPVAALGLDNQAAVVAAGFGYFAGDGGANEHPFYYSEDTSSLVTADNSSCCSYHPGNLYYYTGRANAVAAYTPAGSIGYDASDVPSAVSWINGSSVPLDCAGVCNGAAFNSEIRSLAANGSIAGYAGASAKRGTLSGGWLTVLPGIAESSITRANAIDANNEAAGTSSDPANNNYLKPVYWDANGTMTVLPLPSGYTQGEALGMNNNAWIVGYVKNAADSTKRACLWKKDNNQIYQATGLGVLGQASFSVATAVNNSGQIVGYSGGLACKWLNAGFGVVDLNSRTAHPQGKVLARAYAINDQGQIAGATAWGTEANASEPYPINNSGSAIVLVPIPQ